jgi:mono/diheme cytochrome c family protein
MTRVIFAIVLLALLSACRQDMHDQPRFRPLRRSDFFADGRSERPLVPGTVPRGQLREDAYYYSGMMSKTQPGNTIPFPVTAEVLRRGQERFDIYCTPCHSRVGDGNGMVVQRGYRHPPTFHSDTLRSKPVGHFFDVITNGFGAMPDYSQQVAPADRWAIAAYIRVLQFSQHATIADVPENAKPLLTENPVGLPPAPGTTSSGETPQAPSQGGNYPGRSQGAVPGEMNVAPPSAPKQSTPVPPATAPKAPSDQPPPVRKKGGAQ